MAFKALRCEFVEPLVVVVLHSVDVAIQVLIWNAIGFEVDVYDWDSELFEGFQNDSVFIREHAFEVWLLNYEPLLTINGQYNDLTFLI